MHSFLMTLHQIVFFGRISILNLLSNLSGKPTFMALFKILISKLNSSSQITSKYWKPIQNPSQILNLELLTVEVDIDRFSFILSLFVSYPTWQSTHCVWSQSSTQPQPHVWSSSWQSEIFGMPKESALQYFWSQFPLQFYFIEKMNISFL